MDEKKGQGKDGMSLEEEFFSGHGNNEEKGDQPIIEKRGLLIRSPILMVVMIALCVWLMTDFRKELIYFFSNRQVLDLGDAVDVGKSKLGVSCSMDGDCQKNMVCRKKRCVFPVDRYARVVGIPLITRVCKSTVWGTTRNFFPLMGARNRIFISMVRNKKRKRGVIPQRPYSGRLRNLRSSDFQVLREYYIDKFSVKFPEQCYILIDNEKPGDKYTFAVLYAFLSLLLLFNIYTLYKYIVWNGRARKATKVGKS
ncbi:MAG: hypothetical protein GXP49_14690 [Deltaproteobacteria bacterium]|nr:hypothetical protein [Deltaproteobacteria bacterium]